MTVASPSGHPPPAPSERRVAAVVVAGNLPAALGFYAVMAHVVVHLRDDVGLLAGMIGLVLGTRVGVQYALYLAVGPVTDRIGAARAAAVACALRAVGFAVLGAADGLSGLFGAAVLLGAGGALFHPATRSLLAGLDARRRARGFGAYAAAGQVAAVAGPTAGLVLLSDDVLGVLDGGFGVLSGVAAAAWAMAAVLFASLREPGRARRRSSLGVGRSVLAVLRDRPYVRFIVLAAPTTLLPTQTSVVVPLKGFDPGVTTLYLCVSAAVSAAVQPWCAGAGRRGGGVRAARAWVMPVSLALAGTGYLLMVPLDDHGAASVAALVGIAVLHGFSYGLLEPAVFQNVARHAPPAQVGAYYGVMAFVGGVVAFVGGLAVGRLFDLGPAGAAAALAGLGVLALATAAWPAAGYARRAAFRHAASRHAASRRNFAATGAAASAPVPPPSTTTAKARSPR
ncbi:MFS transporter [Actinomadura sp. NPDC047616]|uniref:MFS transporter n=1 Tax=Actinomadura sp. NPDC047616 TaxID=3155914 RepID=UPI0033BFCB59